MNSLLRNKKMKERKNRMFTIQELALSFLIGAYLSLVILALIDAVKGSLNKYGLWLTESRLRKMMRQNNNG